MIGGAVFAAGIALQAFLTSGLHIGSLTSYLLQAVASVEASFLLNRWLTWRDTAAGFWPSFARFNLQKVVTIAANLLLYAGLVAAGVNYLLANAALTAAFTIVNYVGADRFAFGRTGLALAGARTGPLPALVDILPAPRSAVGEPTTRPGPWPELTGQELPSVSVVIPVRGNQTTIRAAVDSVLGQDYPVLRELLLVGSPGDPTWSALEGIDDPRLRVVETETPPGIRDANFKRDLGISQTSGDLVSLVDSDMVLPVSWMSNAVGLLRENRVDCVAGVMRSIRDDFWGRFVDRNILGAKTPRVDGAYVVTAAEFGAAGRKPPITANTLFTRELYEKCPIDAVWSHGSLEDYEWFWRVVAGGHRVLVSGELFGWHHHRAGFGALISEYRRSARGCAYFIRAHWDAPFARRRMAQAVVLPGAAVLTMSSLGCAAMAGNGRQAGLAVLATAAGSGVALSAREFARTRTLESLLYPLPAFVLGTHYTVSLVSHLLRGTIMRTLSTPRWSPPAVAGGSGPRRRRAAVRLHPLAAVLAVQAACSLGLIWSNTAFGDEADYLWIGHLVIAHWLHGASWAQAYAQGSLSGSPLIYPPLAAAADAAGGLAGARLLSMCFMLAATWLLYSAAARLFGRQAALFAAALFALSEPALRLSFATYDPLSVMLAALSGWAVVQVPGSARRGEFVALAGLALALANASAYSTVAIDPVMGLFAVLAWRSELGLSKALGLAGWLGGAWALCLLAVMSVSGSWGGVVSTLFSRGAFADEQSPLLILNNVWSYSGFVLVLAVAGAVLALGGPAGTRRGLLCMLGLTGFVVPLAQLQEQTGWSLDKHVAYGLWFASMAAGYALSAAFTAAVAGRRRYCAAAAAVVVLAYPGYSAWQSAWVSFHAWANSASYVAALKPLLASTPGPVYTDNTYLAQYYTPAGHDWSRWSAISGLPVPTASGVSQATWNAAVRSSGFGLIVFFYPSLPSAGAPAAQVIASDAGSASGQRQLALSGAAAGQPGLAAATLALQADHAYKLVSAGPYNTRSSAGIYAIWRLEQR